jgi:cell division protein FtsW (lipid II flippase)
MFAMLFAAGIRWRHLACVALVGLAVSPLFWLKMSAEQKSRIIALFTQVDGGPNPGGDRWHQHQSKVVLSMGGLWGSELSGQRIDDVEAYRLYASQSDFVFCLIGERWGLIGISLTLLLYVVFLTKGLQIAARTREPFGRLLAVGIVTLWATQTIINTGMTVGLLPVVGITIPLLSSGGSSLLMTAVSLGLLLNVGARPGYEVAGEPFQFG